TLRAAGAIANRDFVLRWRAGGAGVRPIVRFERAPDGEGTFLLCFTPPSEPGLPRTEARGGAGELKAIRCGNCGGLVTDLGAIREIPGLGPAVPCSYCGAVLAPSTEAPFTRATRPRDVLVLVDRSASMRASLPAARRAVRALLEALPAGDAVQVIAFDHERHAFDGSGRSFVTVAPEVVNEIDAFVAGLSPRGGTELEKALERAAELPRREGRTSVVVLVTDLAVGNEGRLVRRAKELLGERRLYVLGVGPAVDRRLAERLARRGGGASEVLGPREDVEPVIARFARRVRDAGPVLTGLSLSASGRAVRDVVPRPLPDLFSGEPVIVLGRFDAIGPCTFVLTGTSADGRPFRQEVHVELPEASDEAPGLARVWAKHRIDALLESEAREEDVKAEVIRLALAFSLATKHTSLVAVDDEVRTKGAPRRVVQPSAAAEREETRAPAAPLEPDARYVTRAGGAPAELDAHVARSGVAPASAAAEREETRAPAAPLEPDARYVTRAGGAPAELDAHVARSGVAPA
ncbi:MAG TPA: VWA domain-containing protein, partial [Sandaracinaceae bacterium]